MPHPTNALAFTPLGCVSLPISLDQHSTMQACLGLATACWEAQPAEFLLFTDITSDWHQLDSITAAEQAAIDRTTMSGKDRTCIAHLLAALHGQHDESLSRSPLSPVVMACQTQSSLNVKSIKMLGSLSLKVQGPSRLCHMGQQFSFESSWHLMDVLLVCTVCLMHILPSCLCPCPSE